jgi:hypothetical protein
MNIYFNLRRRLPELRKLTTEQRRGVQRIFQGDRFFLFAGLAGGIGLCIALISTRIFDLSREVAGVLMTVCSLSCYIAFLQYQVKRLRPRIAEYVFIHFRPKSA